MRNLTVKRNKAFPACAVSMHVYVEDPAGEDIVVNGAPCRYLGSLKSGEEGTYVVSENEAKLYVIPEKSGKVYKEEFYPLPAGSDPVTVSGKNVLEAVNGNPFRFDGITSDAIIKSRKNSKKQSITVIVIAIALVIVASLVMYLPDIINSSSPAVFTESGMEITLTKAFKPMNHDDFLKVYASSAVDVMLTKNAFSDYPGSEAIPLDDYASAFHSLATENGSNVSDIKKSNGLTYVEYNSEGNDGEIYHYFSFIYKSNDAFWIIEFGVDTNAAESIAPKILEYAGSVKFS